MGRVVGLAHGTLPPLQTKDHCRGSQCRGSSSSRLHTASTLTCHPLWAPTTVCLKLPVTSQGSHVLGLYLAARPVWASLPFSVHSLCRHQFRVRVTTLIKATASVCVHVSLLLTLNRPLLGDLGLPISENRGTDLVKISASPSHAPGLGFRRTIWTECMPAHSLQVCPRGRCSEQGETGEETGMAKCPSLPPG